MTEFKYACYYIDSDFLHPCDLNYWSATKNVLAALESYEKMLLVTRNRYCFLVVL